MNKAKEFIYKYCPELIAVAMLILLSVVVATEAYGAEQPECVKLIEGTNAFVKTYDCNHDAEGITDGESNGSETVRVGGNGLDGSNGNNNTGSGGEGNGSGEGDNGSTGDDNDSGNGSSGKGNASANNGKGGNYGNTGHSDNGKGNGKGRK